MNRFFILLYFVTGVSASAIAQQQSVVEKTDSILAVLPQLSGDERLKALSVLVTINDMLPDERAYINMYLEEARRQGNVVSEAQALKMLMYYFYPNADCDSVFIVGEEAVRLTRQHKLYDELFLIHHEMIRRHNADGQKLTALRKAEAAYAEAKELQKDMPMAYVLSAMGIIYYNLEQYEEALHYMTESIELATPYRQTNPSFILNAYYFSAIMSETLERPHEMLRFADSMQVELDYLQRNNIETNRQVVLINIENNRAIGYAETKRPELALEAIRRVEAIIDQQWQC
jgi:tetratricopeptide (TPR) repeat protein